MPEESTTPDLQETVRRSLEALCRRNFDGAVAPFSVHAVFDLSAVDGEVVEGREAIREFMEAWRGPYGDFELEVEEFRDLGNGVTFALVGQRGWLPGSGAFLSVRGGYIGVWQGGLIERNTVYPDVDEARAAAERLAEERG